MSRLVVFFRIELLENSHSLLANLQKQQLLHTLLFLWFFLENAPGCILLIIYLKKTAGWGKFEHGLHLTHGPDMSGLEG